MKTLKFISIMLFVLVIGACTKDDNRPNTSATQNSEIDETPQTTESTETSEEPAPNPETEQDSTATQNTTVAKHYYELTFSGGPMNGKTLADSLGIEKGFAKYSDVEGPGMMSILISDGNVFIYGLLTRFDEADSFPIIDEDQIQDQTAAHLAFSFVPPGPSITGYTSRSGTLELSDLEIYKLLGTDLAAFKIDFEGSFNYFAPPEEDETVQISGSIIIRQHAFNLPDLKFPD